MMDKHAAATRVDDRTAVQPDRGYGPKESIWISARLAVTIANAAAAGYQIVSSQEFPGTYEWYLTEDGSVTDCEGYFATVEEALQAASGDGIYFNNFLLAA